MRLALTWAAAALAAAALTASAIESPAPAARHPSSDLPLTGRPVGPETDATRLPGTGLTDLPRVSLPGEDSRGRAVVRMRAGDRERAYVLAPARRARPGTPPALLVVLPAGSISAGETYDSMGLDSFRDHGFAVAVLSTVDGWWSAGACCVPSGRPARDDVAAIRQMSRDAALRAGARPTGMAVLGYSAGAFMAWHLVCEEALPAAAVVEIAGSVSGDCPARDLTPHVMGLHGALDRTVPFLVSERTVPLLGAVPPAVRPAAARAARAGGCVETPGFEVPEGRVVRWENCRGGGSVSLRMVEAAGHSWHALDATARAAAFFAITVDGVA